MGIIQEFRHLDSINGAFGVIDEEFLATATLQEIKPSPKNIAHKLIAFLIKIHLTTHLGKVRFAQDDRNSDHDHGLNDPIMIIIKCS